MERGSRPRARATPERPALRAHICSLTRCPVSRPSRSPCAQHSTWHTLPRILLSWAGARSCGSLCPALALPPPWLRPASPCVLPGLPCVLHGPPDSPDLRWPSARPGFPAAQPQLCSEAGGACLFLRLFSAVHRLAWEGHRAAWGWGEQGRRLVRMCRFGGSPAHTRLPPALLQGPQPGRPARQGWAQEAAQPSPPSSAGSSSCCCALGRGPCWHSPVLAWPPRVLGVLSCSLCTG